jgi:hypothetical protein
VILNWGLNGAAFTLLFKKVETKDWVANFEITDDGQPGGW